MNASAQDALLIFLPAVLRCLRGHGLFPSIPMRHAHPNQPSSPGHHPRLPCVRDVGQKSEARAPTIQQTFTPSIREIRLQRYEVESNVGGKEDLLPSSTNRRSGYHLPHVHQHRIQDIANVAATPNTGRQWPTDGFRSRPAEPGQNEGMHIITQAAPTNANQRIFDLKRQD